MDNAVAAIIAVVGTLLGSALAYFFQSRAAERAEEVVFQRDLWAERVSAYGSYLAALTEFRRGQLDWYERRKEDPDSEATLNARIESYRRKGVALTALSRVQLVARDQELVASATEAFELTRPVHYARDSAELESRSSRAKEALSQFVVLAAAELQSPSGAR